MHVSDLMTPEQKDASQQGGTPGRPLWDAAINAMGTTDLAMAWPEGVFLFYDTLVVDRLVEVYGQFGGTYFFFIGDCPGVQVEVKGTYWEGIAIRSDATMYGGNDSTGFCAAGSVTLRRCSIDKFSGTGILIDGVSLNSNHWRLDHVMVKYCGGDGFKVIGKDGNGGLAEQLDCSVNGGIGINDSSLLGNLFVASHTSSNGRKWGNVSHNGKLYRAGRGVDAVTPPAPDMTDWAGPWVNANYDSEPVAGWRAWAAGTDYRFCPDYTTTGSVSKPTFVNGYTEEGAPPAEFNKYTTVVGGVWPGGINGVQLIRGDLL